MGTDTIVDAELGELRWNEALEFWEGAIRLSSGGALKLVVFARSALVAGRVITPEARRAIVYLSAADQACRAYACAELLDVHNAEWAEGDPTDAIQFMGQLELEEVEVHESGYSEAHYAAADLFWGHSVGVRLRPDGSFQEAVLEG